MEILFHDNDLVVCIKPVGLDPRFSFAFSCIFFGFLSFFFPSQGTSLFYSFSLAETVESRRTIFL